MDNSADARLHTFLAGEWAYSLRRSPEFASYQGDRSGDDRWDDVSLAASEEDASHARDALTRLQALDRPSLSEAGRLNAELYEQQLRESIRGFELRTHLFALSTMSGVHTDSTIVQLLPFDSARDFEALIARINTWPRKVDQTIEVLEEAIRRGRVWPRVVMERVPAQMDRLDVAAEDHPLFAPFKTMPSSIEAAEAGRLRDAAREGIVNHLLPAQSRFKDFMTGTYLPAAPVEVGLSRLPQGDELYDFRLKTNTTTNLGAQEIHDLGLREVARILDEMRRVAPATGYHGTLQEVFSAMRSDPANYYATGADLLIGYQALAKRIDPELVKLFNPLPRQPYGVLAIPDAIAPDTTTAYYQPGSLDGLRAGAMYCNLYKPDSRPIYEMPVLTLHEAMPGHHLQFAIGAEQGELPNFRRVAYYVGYGEGWGLYSESLGYDLGVYDSPKAILGALTYDMWRAVRLVVDTGMHAFGWTRDRAIDYFLENAPKTKHDVTNEIDRYITYPGQACAYKVGQLKILELRDRAKAQLGPAFDIREFHAVVLGAGSIPLSVLEARVDEWLAGSLTAPAPR